MKRLLLAILAVLFSQLTLAQFGGGGTVQQVPREAAPVDLTGYWVSVVSEDWMFRMVTPPRGEFRGVPLNQEGRRLANAWDPELDESMGDACKSYGAAAIMRVPGRLHITWTDDETLQVETEAGNQVRTFHFNATNDMGTQPSLQGFSRARWNIASGGGHGKLEVTTDNLAPGYLRKNGIPYSASATVNEYFTVYDTPNGDTWLVATVEVVDPQFLSQPFVTSSHFKKLDNGYGQRYWTPEECSAQ